MHAVLPLFHKRLQFPKGVFDRSRPLFQLRSKYLNVGGVGDKHRTGILVLVVLV